MDIREMVTGELYLLTKPCRVHIEPRISSHNDAEVIAGIETVMFLGELGGEDLYGKPLYGRFLTSKGSGWIHKVAFK